MQITAVLRTSMELDLFTVPGCSAYGVHSVDYTGHMCPYWTHKDLDLKQ